MARAALDIGCAELSRLAGVGINTVSRFEQGGDARRSSVEAIKSALEAAGVVFVASGEVSRTGGAGVRLADAG